MKLPPGQRAIEHFPPFGGAPFAERSPREPRPLRLQLGGDLLPAPRALDDAEWATLPRHEQRSDFHCVTTWSRCGLHWSGVRLREFIARCVPLPAGVDAAGVLVVLRALDGYHAALPLADLLADDVLLADRLDGAPLPLEHGAPLRLVAPAHYGYKSVKHLKAIEFRRSADGYRPIGPRFMAHPRARVAFEERGNGVPGWLLRHLYRPLIGLTARRFEAALARRHSA